MSMIQLPRGEAAAEAGKRLMTMSAAPAMRQAGRALIVAAAIAVGLMVFFWSQKPDLVPLYAGLDAKATAEATDLLRAAEIPFEMDPVSGTISVARDKLFDARLKLAGAGLADGGQPGFEMIEKDPGFGVSQFVETARYQRALETELARTISSLRPVRDARVHLAIPRPSAFTRQREPASASVVLELQGGAMLERNQVEAIVRLVASSIPDLGRDRVTVVDQAGQLLSETATNPDAARSAMQFEQVRRAEQSYQQRIQDLLSPMTGHGRVSTQVAVDMDFSESEEAREVYNDDPAKLRSEQTSESMTTEGGTEGVPGAASNDPAQMATADPDAANPPTQTSRSATRNYELDRTLSHTRQPGGRINRVTAAVLVDNVPRTDAEGNTTLEPLSAEDLARMESLVKEAIGFSAERGDSVSVVNSAFVRTADDPAFEEPPFWQNPMLLNIAKPLLGAIAVLALLFGVLRPALKQLVNPAPQAAAKQKEAPEVAVVEERFDEDGPELAPALATAGAAALPHDPHQSALQQAREAVNADARRVAQVVKTWVNAET
ncbi:flagellar basal-body MS-ring/collar protein FliF [Coralloluteibacterium stylophorae]|uniref:Flagellar M-ring protein n=2 Tax=Coralloluteibacterium stylophorae TaxID=1776034 RepID=A0A8J7VUQ3_9GAMM|nr:flagellar M-ring protein FliF [Coralloluteibacterium stylophorae]